MSSLPQQHGAIAAREIHVLSKISPRLLDIANAAKRLSSHFGYSANATYMVFTPHGKSMNGFATQWCAWHSSTSSPQGTVAYAYIPYQPDAGASCGVKRRRILDTGW